ncbi:MAG: hypothetical protein K0S68_237 [Candidatus Saccharibacteria bacterium]|nr:hypothetical protein [Candidatus Saccharibacteria bacterium]
MHTILFNPDQDLNTPFIRVGVADNGGSGLKLGVFENGQITHFRTVSSTDPTTNFTDEFAAFLAELADEDVILDFVQIVSTGAPYVDDKGAQCVDPQNGRKETINASKIATIASRIMQRKVTVRIGNDVEALVPVVWHKDTKVRHLFGPPADPSGSGYTLMGGTGLGQLFNLRLPDGTLAYHGMETGHLPTAESLTNSAIASRYHYLADDLAATHRYITSAGLRWDVEYGGGSCQGLAHALHAIRGDTQFTEYDGKEATEIAYGVTHDMPYAWRAMCVTTFAVANAILNASLFTVPGGIRLCGPLFRNIDVMMRMGLPYMVSVLGQQAAYQGLVNRTPVLIAENLPEDWSLIGAGLTALSQWSSALVPA